MARKYRRDARGRFASGGYQGQTGGRGARLKSGGNVRKGGGAKVRAAAAPMRAGTIAKGGNGVRGSVARSLAAVKRGRVGTISPPSRARNTSAARPSNTIRKPRGIEVGSVTNRIMEKDRATIKATTERIERADKRNRQLRTVQSQIDYRRANPVGGKAARGQATKRLNKQQRKLDKSRSKVFGAVESVYKPQREAAYSRLAQVTRARQSVAGSRQGRKGSTLQRNIFGGATASYQ